MNAGLANELIMLPVTVVISTRDRGATITTTIATVLLNDYPDFEVIVVDQSEDDVTRASLRQFLVDPRLRYIRSTTKGVSDGRNLGLANARTELIAVTDDDCEVPTNWIQELVAAFALDRQIGIVFGNVLPGPHDPASVFVIAYSREQPFLARGIRDKHHVEGTSACMGVRRSVWQALGGFDWMLGVGAPLKSGGEVDFTIRALLAGYYTYETPRLTLVHRGSRPLAQRRLVIERYWYGTGAVLAKQLKCGQWAVLRLVLHLAWRWAFGRSPIATSLGDGSHKWSRLRAFVRGLGAGGLVPVDRSTGHYVRLEKMLSRRP